MEKVSRDDILSLLGFSDPRHSYAWYREHYSNLISDVKALIIQEVRQHLSFPKETRSFNQREKCQKYYHHIEVVNGNPVVFRNDTDRGEVFQNKMFADLEQAADYFIKESYNVGGAIKDYWK